MNSRILTIDEEHELRINWKRLDSDTRISWRDYWLTAQRDLTLKEVGELIDKYIGGGNYEVEVPEWGGKVRGTSADLEYVWKALKQEIDALKRGELPKE